MTAVETIQNTVYLTWVGADDARHVQDDFQTYPFPGWQLDVLGVGGPVPLNLLAGQAVLVVGCGGRSPVHSEAMWLLRLFACGCPWIAVADSPDAPGRELCEAAGAVAYMSRPLNASHLRDLIWRFAIPLAGKTPVPALTCERMLRYFAVLEADVLLKFTTEAGNTGFLAIKKGVPIHAQVLDGSEGAAALREILNWGKGKVLGQPLPTHIPPNLPPRPEAWVQQLRAPQRRVPGGREACDRIVSELSDLTTCALVDLNSGHIAARPSPEQPGHNSDPAFAAGVADVLRTPLMLADPDLPAEEPSEIVVLGQDAWWAATRINSNSSPLVFVLSASGQPHLGLAHQAIAAAAAEIESRSGMVVEERFDESII